MGEYAYIVVPRVPSGRSERMQVFPGLTGEIMAVNGQGKTVVRVNKQEGMKALDRAEKRTRDEFDAGMALIEATRELFRETKEAADESA